METTNKKKLLDIPMNVIVILTEQAQKERKSVKALMESILIDAAKTIKNKL